MPRRLWLRLGLVAVVMAFSIWFLVPTSKHRPLNLGLALQGGIPLVLGVETDKFIASQTERAAEDFKNALERKGVGLKKVAPEGLGRVVVELANPSNGNAPLTGAAESRSFDATDGQRKP